MIRTVVSSAIAVVVLTLVLGFGYPLLMTGFAQVAFQDKANGSLIERDGKVVGSELAAQEFTSPRYFHSRPSATAPAYNAGGDDVREPRADEPGSGEEREGRRREDPRARAPVQPGPQDR